MWVYPTLFVFGVTLSNTYQAPTKVAFNSFLKAKHLKAKRFFLKAKRFLLLDVLLQKVYETYDQNSNTFCHYITYGWN